MNEMITKKICNENKPESPAQKFVVKITATTEVVVIADSTNNAIRLCAENRNRYITDRDYVTFDFECRGWTKEDEEEDDDERDSVQSESH